jgi:hypothetical protein
MTYRKWGRTVRYENGVTIRVEEAGEANETDGAFQAAPIETRRAQLRWAELPWAAAGDDDRNSAQRSWALRLPDGVTAERLIVSNGIAQHETGGVTWYEESMRVHLALVNPPLRALIDLASFDLTIIETIASALARAGDERDAPRRVRLAPNVSAALLPSLIGELAMEQSGGGFDGKGQTIETRAITSGQPPNWYRPGYAVPPIRAWLNIRALPFGSIDPNAPLAVALLGPIEGAALRVLCVDGSAVYSATINASHIAAVSRDDATWYPYAAGSFGVEMML